MSDKDTISSSLKKRIKEDQKTLSEIKNIRKQMKQKIEADIERSKMETINLTKTARQSAKTTIDSIKKQIKTRHDKSGNTPAYYIQVPALIPNQSSYISPRSIITQQNNWVQQHSKALTIESRPLLSEEELNRINGYYFDDRSSTVEVYNDESRFNLEQELYTADESLAYKNIIINNKSLSMNKNIINNNFKVANKSPSIDEAAIQRNFHLKNSLAIKKKSLAKSDTENMGQIDDEPYIHNNLNLPYKLPPMQISSNSSNKVGDIPQIKLSACSPTISASINIQKSHNFESFDSKFHDFCKTAENNSAKEIEAIKKSDIISKDILNKDLKTGFISAIRDKENLEEYSDTLQPNDSEKNFKITKHEDLKLKSEECSLKLQVNDSKKKLKLYKGLKKISDASILKLEPKDSKKNTDIEDNLESENCLQTNISKRHMIKTEDHKLKSEENLQSLIPKVLKKHSKAFKKDEIKIRDEEKLNAVQPNVSKKNSKSSKSKSEHADVSKTNDSKKNFKSLKLHESNINSTESKIRLTRKCTPFPRSQPLVGDNLTLYSDEFFLLNGSSHAKESNMNTTTPLKLDKSLSYPTQNSSPQPIEEEMHYIKVSSSNLEISDSEKIAVLMELENNSVKSIPVKPHDLNIVNSSTDSDKIAVLMEVEENSVKSISEKPHNLIKVNSSTDTLFITNTNGEKNIEIENNEPVKDSDLVDDMTESERLKLIELKRTEHTELAESLIEDIYCDIIQMENLESLFDENNNFNCFDHLPAKMTLILDTILSHEFPNTKSSSDANRSITVSPQMNLAPDCDNRLCISPLIEINCKAPSEYSHHELIQNSINNKNPIHKSRSFSARSKESSKFSIEGIDWDGSLSGDSCNTECKPVGVSSSEILNTLIEIKELLKKNELIKIRAPNKTSRSVCDNIVDINENQHNFSQNSLKNRWLLKQIFSNISYIKKNISGFINKKSRCASLPITDYNSPDLALTSQNNINYSDGYITSNDSPYEYQSIGPEYKNKFKDTLNLSESFLAKSQQDENCNEVINNNNKSDNNMDSNSRNEINANGGQQIKDIANVNNNKVLNKCNGDQISTNCFTTEPKVDVEISPNDINKMEDKDSNTDKSENSNYKGKNLDDNTSKKEEICYFTVTNPDDYSETFNTSSSITLEANSQTGSPRENIKALLTTQSPNTCPAQIASVPIVKTSFSKFVSTLGKSNPSVNDAYTYSHQQNSLEYNKVKSEYEKLPVEYWGTNDNMFKIDEFDNVLNDEGFSNPQPITNFISNGDLNEENAMNIEISSISNLKSIATLEKECDNLFGCEKEEVAELENIYESKDNFDNPSEIFDNDTNTNVFKEWMTRDVTDSRQQSEFPALQNDHSSEYFNRFRDISNVDYYNNPFRNYDHDHQRSFQGHLPSAFFGFTPPPIAIVTDNYLDQGMDFEEDQKYESFENIIKQSFNPRNTYINMPSSLVNHNLGPFMNDREEIIQSMYHQGYSTYGHNHLESPIEYQFAWNIRSTDEQLNDMSDLDGFDSLQEEDVLEIQIDRHSETMLLDLLQFYKEAPKQLLLARLHVNFLGEPGVDGGALSKEFFQLVFQKLVDATINSRSLFEGVRGHLLPANDHVLCEMQVYWFIGVLSAQALCNGCHGFSCLAEPVRLFVMSGGRMSQIPKLIDSVTDDDIADLNLRTLIKKLRTKEELTDEEDKYLREWLDLSGFTFVFNSNTREKAIVHLIQYYIFEARLPCLLSMAEGLWDMENLHFHMDPDGKLLFPKEEKIDVETFFNSLNFVCDSNVFESRNILLFFRMFCSELANRQIDGLSLTDLLRFFTGEPYVKSGLKVRIAGNDCLSKMPMAHTCESQLILPCFRGQNYEEFKDSFMKALRLASFGFGFA